MSLREAALEYSGFGWATVPLRNNDDGIAKIPIVPEWQKLMPEDAESLPWEQAQGIGIVLGRNSLYMGVIDIDDDELACELAAYLILHDRPLMAYTARRRIHIYVQESDPSPTRKLHLLFRERQVLVELRSTDAQCALPPTPGYEWANRAWEPFYGSLSEVWAGLMGKVGVSYPDPRQKNARSGSVAAPVAGYPTGWATSVSHGERNDACFYESACLKDARMPMEQAWAFMEGRIRACYQAPVNWQEMRKTFESAFRRPAGENAKVRRVYGGIGIE